MHKEEQQTQDGTKYDKNNTIFTIINQAHGNLITI